MYFHTMNKCIALLWIGTCLIPCGSREPFKPKPGSLPFLIYLPSRYRGLCVGTLVSRTAALTAAVCVTNPTDEVQDTRPINVVVGTHYRHPRRGIRVQVTKILVPNVKKMSQLNRGYLAEQSCAVLLLKKKVPDVLVEHPLRPVVVDYSEEDPLHLQEECLTAGWHFFYKGDQIYPGHKFLLQRNVRVQFVNIVRKNLWCEALTIKFQKALSNMGFIGIFEKTGCVCIRDPEQRAQPCHGMYGAPLICKGKAVGMLMAPDAQWSNCTGYSSLIHLFAGRFLHDFMTCVSRLFEVEQAVDWDSMKKAIFDRSSEEYDFLPEIYDKIGAEGSDELD